MLTMGSRYIILCNALVHLKYRICIIGVAQLAIECYIITIILLSIKDSLVHWINVVILLDSVSYSN